MIPYFEKNYKLWTTNMATGPNIINKYEKYKASL